MSKRAPRPRPEAAPAPRPRPTPAPKEDLLDRALARLDRWPAEARRSWYIDHGAEAILDLAEALRQVRQAAELAAELAPDPEVWEAFRQALAGPVSFALELALAKAREAAPRAVQVLTEAVELDLADTPNPRRPAIAG